MKHDTGGSMFGGDEVIQVPPSQYAPQGSHVTITTGLTIRDHFASSAPTMTIETAARLLNWPADLPMGDGDNEDHFEDTKFDRWKALSVAEQAAAEAQWAYMYADAMIRERSKQ